MAQLLFRLRGVPDDEADEIRQLLESNHVEFYETSGGSWGLSMAAIWIRDDARFDSATVLIQDYQESRTAAAREEYATQRKEGQTETVLHRLLHRPLTVIVLLLLCVFVVYFSVIPFLL